MIEAATNMARPQMPADSELPGQPLPPSALELYKGLMQLCWQASPKARPTFDEVRSCQTDNLLRMQPSPMPHLVSFR